MLKILLQARLKKLEPFWGLFLWCLLIFFLELVGLVQPVKILTQNLTKPLLSLNTNLVQAALTPYQELRHSYKAARRVQDLERKFAEASARLGELEQLKLENQKLRALLENSDRTLSPTQISTPILSYGQPAIDAGSNQGIDQFSPVLVEKTMVGLVSQALPDFSYVELLYQAKTQPVLAQTETGVQGLVKGDGKRVLLTELPADAVLEIGQRIETVGQKGIDRGLLIGRVRSIETGQSAGVKTVTIEQYVSFYDAVIVEVR